jgi:hypothetical protein
VLGRWRTWLYVQLAMAALSPARFYHLPPNRIVELGAQLTLRTKGIAPLYMKSISVHCSMSSRIYMP